MRRFVGTNVLRLELCDICRYDPRHSSNPCAHRLLERQILFHRVLVDGQVPYSVAASEYFVVLRHLIDLPVRDNRELEQLRRVVKAEFWDEAGRRWSRL